MSYIKFVEEPFSTPHKTRLWGVWTVDGDEPLGAIKWFGRWRCYSFFPAIQTVFERKCLRDLADFCEARTQEHRVKP